MVGGESHAEKVTGDHDHDYQQRGQNGVARQHQADRQEQDLNDLAGDRVEGVGLDALEGDAPLLDGGHDAAQAGAGHHHTGG